MDQNALVAAAYQVLSCPDILFRGMLRKVLLLPGAQSRMSRSWEFFCFRSGKNAQARACLNMIYDVTACESKVLPGKWGFIAQLNEGRLSKKQATEFRVDQVLQSFDPSKFNFMKANQMEVLFCFEEAGNERPGYYAASTMLNSPNIVVINVSPIEYGHVLLVPRVLDCLPQRIDADALLVALHFAAEADNPYFRVGYNSLGAFATINHLHFQAYYLACLFPVERAQTARIDKKRSK